MLIRVITTGSVCLQPFYGVAGEGLVGCPHTAQQHLTQQDRGPIHHLEKKEEKNGSIASKEDDVTAQVAVFI